jgi:glycosyltransferase involved in cell wall biosynthesis
MTISLIIPVQNRSSLLTDCLASVAAQSVAPDEVIVVDDGSTEEIAPVLAAHYPTARLIRLFGVGPGAARDAGARAAKGEHLFFLDSDDLLLPWALESTRRQLSATARPAGVLCLSGRVFWQDGEPVPRPERKGHAAVTHADYFSLSHTPFFMGASGIIVAREAYLRCGGFPRLRINAEDSALLLRLGVEPGFTLLSSPITTAVRMHPGNISRSARLNLRGGLHMLATERHGGYPGGTARAAERRRIICTHVRSMSVAALNAGWRRSAWIAYLKSFRWQLALGKLKYIIGFPLLAGTFKDQSERWFAIRSAWKH